MSGFLIDTNCISEATRPSPNASVAKWFQDTDDSLVYLSVLTLGEIRKGIQSVSPGRRRARLEMWFEMDLLRRHQDRILPITAAVADRWGRLTVQTRAIGATLPTIDGLLAATAIEHNLTIATRNVRDFTNASVPVFNPWT